jgi:glycosyltransferase involved in cell wall biosynthesis
MVWDFETWAEGSDDLRAAMRDAFAQPGVELVAGSAAVSSMLHAMDLGPVATIPPGIDHSVFGVTRPSQDRDDLVGFLHRPVAHRGMDVLLDALGRVRAGNPDARFAASGQVPAGLPPWVTWKPAPTDDDLAAFYNSLAIFVLPSRAEGLGLPALEAMACGAALVITDNGGSSQFARDGENAVVVPPGDASALEMAIETLLTDNDLRSAIAEAGRRSALAYAWDRAVDDFEAVLERAM